MPATSFLADALLNHVLRGVTYSAPAGIYVALFDADPGDAGTELSGGGYARTAATFTTSSGGVSTNEGTVQFPQATAAWGTARWFSLFDAPSAGNRLADGQLTSPKAVDAGEIVRFAAGSLEVEIPT